MKGSALYGDIQGMLEQMSDSLCLMARSAEDTMSTDLSVSVNSQLCKMCYISAGEK